MVWLSAMGDKGWQEDRSVLYILQATLPSSDSPRPPFLSLPYQPQFEELSPRDLE